MSEKDRGKNRTKEVVKEDTERLRPLQKQERHRMIENAVARKVE